MDVVRGKSLTGVIERRLTKRGHALGVYEGVYQLFFSMGWELRQGGSTYVLFKSFIGRDMYAFLLEGTRGASIYERRKEESIHLPGISATDSYLGDPSAMYHFH